MSSVNFVLHTGEILALEKKAAQLALEEIGLTAEGYAKKACPVDTGRLRNSISHAVDGKGVVIGTNVEYGAFIELGTGQYNPTGRKTPWVYKDVNGVWHKTSGNKPQPYLKPAAANHASTYINILKSKMMGN